ncbi:hypothetical protein V8E36_008942 [Tilletia maclaganii]
MTTPTNPTPEHPQALSVATQAALLADKITALCQPTTTPRDLYFWRSVLALWHEADIFADQPLELGGLSSDMRKTRSGHGGGGPSHEQTQTHGAYYSLKTSSKDAQVRLDEFENELARRRWIKQDLLQSRFPDLDAAGPQREEREGQPQFESLAAFEKSNSGLTKRTMSMPWGYALPRRRSTFLFLKRSGTNNANSGSSSRARLHSTGGGTFSFLRRGSSSGMDEDETGGRPAKIRNPESRVLVEQLLDLHRRQIEELRGYEARVLQITAAGSGAAAGLEGLSDVGDQLASYAFGGPSTSAGARSGPPPDAPSDNEASEPATSAADGPKDENGANTTPAPSPTPPVVPKQEGKHLPPPPSLPLTSSLNDKIHDALPRLDDYRCAICLSLAFRPVLLPGCAHLFCIRCLVKLQRRFFASLQKTAYSSNSVGNVAGLGTTGADDGIPRSHAGPLRSAGSVAWVLYDQEVQYLYDQEVQYRESIRAQQRVREEILQARAAQAQVPPPVAEGEERSSATGARAVSGLGSQDASSTTGLSSTSAPPVPSSIDPLRRPSANPTARNFSGADCPLCRQPQAVALADGSNVSMELERTMRAWFPLEVKVKKKADAVEVEREEALGLGLDKTKCTVM